MLDSCINVKVSFVRGESTEDVYLEVSPFWPLYKIVSEAILVLSIHVSVNIINEYKFASLSKV